LIFGAGDYLFGLKLDTVLRVDTIEAPDEIKYGDRYCGTVKISNSTIPFVDLRKKLNSHLAGKPVLIRYEHPYCTLGILSDNLSGIQEIEKESLIPFPEIVVKSSRDILQGFFLKGRQVILFVNGGKLISMDDMKIIEKMTVV